MALDEQFQLSKRKKREDADLDITPMIDITFLLLAFFVMVSKLDPQLPIDMPQAQFGTSVPEKNCVVLVVAKGETEDSFRIFKGSAMDKAGQVAPGEDTEMEAEIGEFVEDQFSQNPNLVGVLIKGEGDTTAGAIDVAKRGAGKSKLARDRLLYIGVAEN